MTFDGIRSEQKSQIRLHSQPCQSFIVIDLFKFLEPKSCGAGQMKVACFASLARE